MNDSLEQDAGELDIDQAAAENQTLIQALVEAEDGTCKNASAASSKMIRRRIRENGFARKILPPQQIADSDLDRLIDSEMPAIIEDMEPDQPGAKSISFNDTPDTEFYRADRFLVLFNKT